MIGGIRYDNGIGPAELGKPCLYDGHNLGVIGDINVRRIAKHKLDASQ